MPSNLALHESSNRCIVFAKRQNVQPSTPSRLHMLLHDGAERSAKARACCKKQCRDAIALLIVDDYENNITVSLCIKC